jgi:hypothetical protein
MRKPNPKAVRVEELKTMLSSYRLMTVEEVESTGWGDLAVELEGEIWRLEQELSDDDRRPVHTKAA